jgi:hypothetical protein
LIQASTNEKLDSGSLLIVLAWESGYLCDGYA